MKVMGVLVIGDFIVMQKIFIHASFVICRLLLIYEFYLILQFIS